MKGFTLFLLLFISGLGFSQAKLTLEVTKAMSQGVQPGIQVFIPNVSEDNIWNAIKDVTKPFKGKNRSVKNTSEFLLEGAIISEIGVSAIDIYQSIEKGNKGFTYTAFFNLDGLFLDSSNSPEKFSYAEDVVQRIALKAIDYQIAEKAKLESKNVDNDNKKFEKVDDNNSDDDKGL